MRCRSLKKSHRRRCESAARQNIAALSIYLTRSTLRRHGVEERTESNIVLTNLHSGIIHIMNTINIIILVNLKQYTINNGQLLQLGTGKCIFIIILSRVIYENGKGKNAGEVMTAE